MKKTKLKQSLIVVFLYTLVRADNNNINRDFTSRTERGNDNIAVMKGYWSDISALIGRDFDKMKNGKVYNIYLHYCNGILQSVHLFMDKLSVAVEVIKDKLVPNVIGLVPRIARKV